MSACSVCIDSKGFYARPCTGCGRAHAKLYHLPVGSIREAPEPVSDRLERARAEVAAMAEALR